MCMHVCVQESFTKSRTEFEIKEAALHGKLLKKDAEVRMLTEELHRCQELQKSPKVRFKKFIIHHVTP